ncbi:hypothetical protein FRC08_016148 [Ceratobasidium sp. 394]|nr:hypothetical protein FRC08_016148 [Ceratobasidium sp. 394]
MPPHLESHTHRCPFCQKGFRRFGNMRSHQVQTGHWDPPAPDPIALDESMADVDPALLSPAPLNAPSSDKSVHTPPSENMSSFHLSPPAHASTPHASDRGDSSLHLSDNPGTPANISNAAAPYGVATNEEELRVTIRRV